MYYSLHSYRSPAGGLDEQVASWCQSLQPHSHLCCPGSSPDLSSQSPQENKEEIDKSECPTVLLLWSSISPVFPSPESKEDLVFGHDTKGPRVVSCERQS